MLLRYSKISLIVSEHVLNGKHSLCLHVDSILVFIRLEQSGMYFPWDLCFCSGLKVITWHSDQIGDFFLPDAWRQERICVWWHLWSDEEQAWAETVPDNAPGQKKLDSGLGYSWNLGAKKKEGGRKNSKRGNKRKEIEPWGSKTM